MQQQGAQIFRKSFAKGQGLPKKNQTNFQKDFMTLAIESAREAAKLGEVPVAALVADADGRLLALSQNRIERDQDPTAHAELLAIRESLCERQRTQNNSEGRTRWLEGCSLYVTLEPCAMCAAAFLHARLRTLVFAAFDPKGGAVEHGACLLAEARARGRVEVYGGIRETEAQKILRDFFQSLR